MKKLLLALIIFPLSLQASNPFLTPELRHIILLAEQNNPEMQFELAKRYYIGDGIGADKTYAIEWLTKSAEQGNVSAQKALGILYLDGDGAIKADVPKSISWFERAASQNDSEAQVLLTKIYKEGRLVPVDYVKAGQWAELGAVQGNPVSQYYLGTLYHFGQGRAVNLVRAFELYLESANQGYLDAMNNVAGMLFQGYGIHQDQIKGYAYWLAAKRLGSNLASQNLAIKDKENILNEAQKKQAEKLAIQILKQATFDSNSNSSREPTKSTRSKKN